MYCAKQQSVFGRLFTMDCQEHALEHCVIGLFEWMNQSTTTTAFIYFSQGSPISPLRTVINRSPVHPKNYKVQYNLKILKRKFTHYNIAKTSIKEVKISSWPRRKPN